MREGPVVQAIESQRVYRQGRCQALPIPTYLLAVRQDSKVCCPSEDYSLDFEPVVHLADQGERLSFLLVGLEAMLLGLTS